LALKKCAPNELPGAAGTFGSGGQSSRWPSRMSFPWDRSYCCCDCWFQVRGSLGVVAKHPVLKVFPHIKIWGVQVRWMRRPLRSHLQLISRSVKRCCSHANDSFEEWGVAPSCWNNRRTLTAPLCQPSAVQNLASTWTYRSVLIVTDRSLSSSNQNGPMMPWRWQPRQCTSQCNGLCRQCSGVVLPQKMLFLEFTWPDNRKCASSSRDLTTEKYFLPKICHNYKYIFLNSPWHLEGQIW